jgi:hypothetical protein
MKYSQHDHEMADAFFQSLVKLCEITDLPPTLLNAVLTKVLVINSLSECDKAEFMNRMDYVFDFESAMKPDNLEIH